MSQAPEPVPGPIAEPRPPIPEPVEGPRIGTPAPDFSLTDQHGQTVTRSGLSGAPALVVFYPYAFSGICSSELTQLQAASADFAAVGTRLLGVSVDTMFAVRTFGDQLGVDFPLLSDFWPHGAVAEAYGVFDAERGCAIRGSFLLDADGVVRWSVRHEIGAARDISAHLRAARQLGRPPAIEPS